MLGRPAPSMQKMQNPAVYVCVNMYLCFFPGHVCVYIYDVQNICLEWGVRGIGVASRRVSARGISI